jgi:hypothetical protein
MDGWMGEWIDGGWIARWTVDGWVWAWMNGLIDKWMGSG